MTNSGYCPEPLSGVLLYYQRYFCHIVDGPEEILHKHLNLLLKQQNTHLKSAKLLTAIHHVRGVKNYLIFVEKQQEILTYTRNIVGTLVIDQLYLTCMIYFTFLLVIYSLVTCNNNNKYVLS